MLWYELLILGFVKGTDGYVNLKTEGSALNTPVYFILKYFENATSEIFHFIRRYMKKRYLLSKP
jgi:hypothetical protein